MKVVAKAIFHESPGGLYRPGDSLEVSAEKAKELVAAGLVEEVREKAGGEGKPSPADPATRQTKPAAPVAETKPAKPSDKTK